MQELTVFVPPDAPLKVARLRITNTLARHRRLTATYYAEWVLGSLREEQRPYVASEFDAAHDCLLARCNWNADFGDRVAFVASSLKVHGFTTDRAEFLGRRGDYARPEALERWGLSGSVERGVDPCAVVQVHLEIRPGEQVETHFVLGQAASRRRGAPVRDSLSRRGRDRGGVEGDRRVLGRAARDRAGQDARAGDGPHAQPMDALPDALVPVLRANGVLSVERRLRVSRPAAGRAGSSPCGARAHARARARGRAAPVRGGRRAALVASARRARRADALLRRHGLAALRHRRVRARHRRRVDPLGARCPS